MSRQSTFRKTDISLIEIFSILLDFFSKRHLHYNRIKKRRIEETLFDNRLKKFYFQKTIISEISSKNANSKFDNFVLKNNQQFNHFDGKILNI